MHARIHAQICGHMHTIKQTQNKQRYLTITGQTKRRIDDYKQELKQKLTITVEARLHARMNSRTGTLKHERTLAWTLERTDALKATHNKHTKTHKRKHTNKQTHTYTHMFKHLYTHTHTHTHTHKSTKLTPIQ